MPSSSTDMSPEQRWHYASGSPEFRVHHLSASSVGRLPDHYQDLFSIISSAPPNSAREKSRLNCIGMLVDMDLLSFSVVPVLCLFCFVRRHTTPLRKGIQRRDKKSPWVAMADGSGRIIRSWSDLHLARCLSSWKRAACKLSLIFSLRWYLLRRDLDVPELSNCRGKMVQSSGCWMFRYIE